MAFTTTRRSTKPSRRKWRSSSRSSKSLSVQNTAANPLTLADGFNAAARQHPNTFGIDPNFRPGYAQNWQLFDSARSARIAANDRHLSRHQGNPRNAGIFAEYLSGRSDQSLSRLPGRLQLCDVERQFHARSRAIQLRRRLHSGFTASVQYTFAKAIDDDAVLGGVGASASTPVTSAARRGSGGRVQRTQSVGRAELAGPERGTRSFHFRSAASAERDHPVHHRHGTGWRNAAERLEGHAVQRLDCSVTTISAGTGLPLTPAISRR